MSFSKTPYQITRNNLTLNLIFDQSGNRSKIVGNCETNPYCWSPTDWTGSKTFAIRQSRVYWNCSATDWISRSLFNFDLLFPIKSKSIYLKHAQLYYCKINYEVVFKRQLVPDAFSVCVVSRHNYDRYFDTGRTHFRDFRSF